MGIVSPTKSKPTVREDSPPWNRHIASSDQEEVECETYVYVHLYIYAPL